MNQALFDALPFWIAIPVALLLIIGGITAFTGALGLLRLSHFYPRMHAPTMGNTLGVFCILVVSMLIGTYVHERLVFHELIITVLLIITSPVTAILLMGAAKRRQDR
jgi:multicomponent K+:H+ antiporter subunit G